jgi:hypothetical protein
MDVGKERSLRWEGSYTVLSSLKVSEVTEVCVDKHT